MLLELIHRLHHSEGSAWALWAKSQIHLNLQGDLTGTHWDALRELLPAYRKITSVNIGDGRDTAFWEDVWLGDIPLAECLPALHSHFAGQGTSVREVLTESLLPQFQRRLSRQAREELSKLEHMLQDVSLGDDRDERSCFFTDTNQRLMSGMIYRASMKGEDTCPAYQFVWKNIATPRVKFFGWLLTKDRINCKSDLLTKRVLQEDTCAICNQASETADHIISGWPFAQEFWRRIGWQAQNIAGVQCSWESIAPRHMPLICWELWKHRHDVVFRGMPSDHLRLIDACRDSVDNGGAAFLQTIFAFLPLM